MHKSQWQHSQWQHVAIASGVVVLALGLGACGSSKANAPAVSNPPGMSTSALAPATGAASAAPSTVASGTSSPDTPAITSTTLHASANRTPTATASTQQASASTSATAGATSRTSAPCTSNHLSVGKADEQGTAGTLHITVLLTNTGTTACSLTGFPGVSMVDGSGRQVDAAADKLRTVVSTVHLAPGRFTSFSVTVAQGPTGEAVPGCSPIVHARGLRIYPPGERAALFLPVALKGCAQQDVHLLHVTPVGMSG